MASNRVIVIGAGMVGLSTAWFLQRRGAEVAVVERRDVAAGSSWGNAGLLTPSLVLPLAEPALLRSGLGMILSPSSPLYIPPTFDLRVLRFLAGFTRHCTPRQWRRAAAVLGQAGTRMLGAYEEMQASAEAPVQAATSAADPMLAVFSTAAERATLIEEFERLDRLGFASDYRLLDQRETHAAAPLLSDEARFGLALEGQRFLNPYAFVRALAGSVTRGGGEIVSGKSVTSVAQSRGEVMVSFADGSALLGGSAVIATGSWLDSLTRPHGIRTMVQAGRGYSFTVRPEQAPRHPFYLAARRVACTPLGGPEDGLRIAGMMEFRAADAPLDPRRIQAIIDATAPMLTGVDWDARTDAWVGPRPCTPDGLPLIGRTASDRVYVAGGHGMWGIALGPLTGKLVAQQVTGGDDDPLLRACDPLRGRG